MRFALMICATLALVSVPVGAILANITVDSQPGVEFTIDHITLDPATAGLVVYNEKDRASIAAPLKVFGISLGQAKRLKIGMPLMCTRRHKLNAFTRERSVRYECHVPLKYFLKPGASRVLLFGFSAPANRVQ